MKNFPLLKLMLIVPKKSSKPLAISIFLANVVTVFKYIFVFNQYFSSKF